MITRDNAEMARLLLEKYGWGRSEVKSATNPGKPLTLEDALFTGRKKRTRRKGGYLGLGSIR